MARRVFFSFHYENDIWRANQVRNSWVGRNREDCGFWDASLWEATKLKGDAAIYKLIDDGLRNTSVTAVLIGSQTANRKYIEYEILESYKRGNGLLGIYIHNLQNQSGRTDTIGSNPFDFIRVPQNGYNVVLSSLYPTYYWYGNDGYANFGSWVETAARAAGR